MTKQEIFNTVVRGLAGQDWQRSVTTGGTCLYRHPKGLKCAVGHLLTDEEYDPSLEGDDVGHLAGVGMLPNRLLPHLDFLHVLQIEHDDRAEGDSLRDRFMQVGTRYNFDWPDCRIEGC